MSLRQEIAEVVGRCVSWNNGSQLWELEVRRAETFDIAPEVSVELRLMGELLVTMDADEASALRRGLREIVDLAPPGPHHWASPGAPSERSPEPPRNAGKPWTSEMDDDLRAALRDGVDRNVIATRIGRTRGSVLSRAVKLGLITRPRRPDPPS